MADLNYSLNFYVIQMGSNRYDLYNIHTDKCILKGRDKVTIKSFLDTNEPEHSFLSLYDREFPESVSVGYSKDNYSTGTYTYTISEEDFSGAEAGSISDYSFYCPTLDSANQYCGEGLVRDKNEISDGRPTQLEFNFTYNKESNKNKELQENTSDLPYLGDNED